MHSGLLHMLRLYLVRSKVWTRVAIEAAMLVAGLLLHWGVLAVIGGLLLAADLYGVVRFRARRRRGGA